MVSKCANPSCSNRFLYLHRGKVFVFDAEASGTFAAEPGKPSHRIERFWLCEDCCARMTLVFQPGVGVITRPAPVSITNISIAKAAAG